MLTHEVFYFVLCLLVCFETGSHYVALPENNKKKLLSASSKVEGRDSKVEIGESRAQGHPQPHSGFKASWDFMRQTAPVHTL